MNARAVFGRRLAAIRWSLAIGLLLVAVRVTYLGAFSADAVGRPAPTSELPAQRGSIWDREGGPVVIPAYVYELHVATNEIEAPAELASAIAEATGQSVEEVLSRLTDRNRRWLRIADQVPASNVQRMLASERNLAGLHLTRHARRAYPLGAAAGHLTGFVNLEDQGFYGLEGFYDRELRGQPGRMGGRLGTDPRRYVPPTPGIDLVLTIDRELQLAAAHALEQVVREQAASGGTILVLNPRTGAILASTSLPSYDPANYSSVEEVRWLDPAISETYEPGSVVKAMTVAAALDCGAVGPEFTYDDQGFIEYAGLRINNWDRVAHGQATLATILRHSLNVGAVHLALELGPDRFYDYLTAFGFGNLTGVDLDREQPGQVHSPVTDGDSWYSGHLATNSFGQGMASSPLQVAMAMAALANDGVLMRPYVVGARILPDGRIVRTEARSVRRVVEVVTARRVRQLLANAVAEGTPQAEVPGYRVAGKTGTSQIPTPNGPSGYDPNYTIASFVGFLPAEEPAVLVAVKVDRPRATRGSDVAAPVFRTVAEAAIAQLGIPPSAPDEGLLP